MFQMVTKCFRKVMTCRQVIGFDQFGQVTTGSARSGQVTYYGSHLSQEAVDILLQAGTRMD
jgi:hypothetical protein